MYLRNWIRKGSAFTIVLAVLIVPTQMVLAQSNGQQEAAPRPWMDKSLSPDERADMVLKEMTLDEKIQLVHGTGWGALQDDPKLIPAHSNLGAGYVPGIDRLGIPDINQADSAVGIRMAAMQSRYAT